MLDLITGSIWPLIGGLVAVITPFVTLWLGERKGLSKGRNEAEQKRREQELQAHDRINKATTGGDVPRDEHREWLRGKADDWSNH